MRHCQAQAGCRQSAERRAVPGEVTADDLVLAGRAGQAVVLPGHLDGRLGHLRAAALELDRREVARRQLGQEVGQLHRDGEGPLVLLRKPLDLPRIPSALQDVLVPIS